MIAVKVTDGKVQTKLSVAQFNKVIAVDLMGVFLCGREAADDRRRPRRCHLGHSVAALRAARGDRPRRALHFARRLLHWPDSRGRWWLWRVADEQHEPDLCRHE